jgi:hypothetical protein
MSEFIGGLVLRTSQETIPTVGLQVDKHRRRWCREGGGDVWVVLNAFVTSCNQFQNHRESGASRVLDLLLLALALLPSVRRTLGLYILVGVHSQVSMDHRKLFFLCKRAKRVARCSKRGVGRAALGKRARSGACVSDIRFLFCSSNCSSISP